jgi:hypothetical protein
MLNGVRAESTTQEIDDIDVDGSDGGERVEKVESELRACWPFVCGKCIFWWHGRAQLWSCGGRPVAGVTLESRTIGWKMDKFGPLDWGKDSLGRHGLRCQIVQRSSLRYRLYLRWDGRCLS